LRETVWPILEFQVHIKETKVRALEAGWKSRGRCEGRVTVYILNVPQRLVMRRLGCQPKALLAGSGIFKRRSIV
jgi:hypothetical protein